MLTSFSVIVPVYNRARLLERTFASIASQEIHKPAEIALQLVVVDNGSYDGSADLARHLADKYGREGLSTEVINCPERGAARARNAGFEAATGDFVLFFDSDDELAPGTLQAYAEAFSGPERPDLVAGTSLTQFPDGRTWRRGHRSGSMLLNQLNHSILISESFAARRELLERVARENSGHLWNPELRIWDDWELGMRILLAAPSTVRIDHCLTLIHAHSESISGSHYSDRDFSLYEQAITAAERAVMRSESPEKERLMRWFLYRRMMLAGLFAAESRTLFRSDRLTADQAEALYAESQRIRRDVMRMVRKAPYREYGNATLRPALRFAYNYVSRGFRGCASLLRPIL